jgi:hypothetical protein
MRCFAAALFAALVALPGTGTAQDPSTLVLEIPSKVIPGEDTKAALSIPEDGYLLLLSVSKGAVRVMFPARPARTARVGAGDYDLASLDASIPYGWSTREQTVVALFSRTPFDFSAFARYSHWAVNDLPDDEFRRDPVSASVSLVKRLGADETLQVASAVSEPFSDSRDMLPMQFISALRSEIVSRYPDAYHNQYPSMPPLVCSAGSRDVDGVGERCKIVVTRRR